jgi:hypothetical protein
MESRVEKYNDDSMSRAKKNASLYEEVNNMEIDSFDVNSNATVLDNNSSTIDIDKLRDMLDKKYREEPHKHPIIDNNEITNDEAINLDETREYDINTILDKAKENKESDYEVERLKKLRNTQVDILNSLDIDNKNNLDDSEKVQAVKDSESQQLLDLINTINVTEATQSNTKLDPLDLLSDLKGSDDNTVVVGAKDIPEALNNSNVNNNEVKTEIKTEEKSDIDKSFYTTSNMFTQSDFDDFNDLKDEVSATKIIIRILIVVVVIAFIVGIIFLLNRILGWGLF